MPNTIELNKAVPAFSLPATDDQQISIPNNNGKKIVLFFYPKDNTPGCTLEGQDFRDNHQTFIELNTQVYGISRDSIKSHEGFKEKQAFNFDLLADVDEKICLLFDVMKEKNMYGKKVRGIERSTFIINSQGVLVKQWRKVKVAGHVDEVIAAVKELNLQE